MSLPIEFVASATALECYLACPRKFRHRYIDRTPAAGPGLSVAEPMRRGDLFHKLVGWSDLGLDVSIILDAEGDPELKSLWNTYLTFRESLQADGCTVQHNVTLTGLCGQTPVEARLDALVTGPDGSLTIFDWKTMDWPNRNRLTTSAQSKVYPWVVWSADIHDGPVTGIDLVYWFPGEPDDPLRLSCDQAFVDAAADWLAGTIETISSDASFDMTPHRTRCKTCEYLAHCGVRAEDGDSGFQDEDSLFDNPVDEESFEDHWRVS